jgi:hypothetical protein
MTGEMNFKRVLPSLTIFSFCLVLLLANLAVENDLPVL